MCAKPANLRARSARDASLHASLVRLASTRRIQPLGLPLSAQRWDQSSLAGHQ